MRCEAYIISVLFGVKIDDSVVDSEHKKRRIICVLISHTILASEAETVIPVDLAIVERMRICATSLPQCPSSQSSVLTTITNNEEEYDQATPNGRCSSKTSLKFQICATVQIL